MSGVWVPQDMTTQQACKGRKNNTKIMRQLARQFFQWRFRNGYTIPKLTEAFKDRLFTRLDCLYGLQISITKEEWDCRDDVWNKRRKSNRAGKPLFHDHENGAIPWKSYNSGGNPGLPFPIDIANDKLWFEDENCLDEDMNSFCPYCPGTNFPLTPIRPPFLVPDHPTYRLLLDALAETLPSSTNISHTPDDQLSDRDAEGESDDDFRQNQ